MTEGAQISDRAFRQTPQWNTLASYVLRVFIFLQWGSAYFLSRIPSQMELHSRQIIWVFWTSTSIIFAAISIDWFTKRKSKRQWAKTIDTALWILWLGSLACTVMYSISMGTI